jgi:Phosphotransferase enzyme family
MPMPEHATVPTDPADHPAVRAWGRLRPGAAGPGPVEDLTKKRKTAIFRLTGAGPGGTAVIAKRCRPATAWVERTIYEEVLPRLPVTAPRLYGAVEEDAGLCWLFLEDVGGELYSPQAEEHRTLAGRWLGLLHTSAARVAAAAGLPDRGPGHYLVHLRAARDAAVRGRANPTLTADEAAELGRIAAQCDALEARWGEVRALCARIPPTLVHGDLVVKNVRVRAGADGADLLPFDWATGGWGVPAADLAQLVFEGKASCLSPDVATYRSVVREAWPHLGGEDIRRLVDLGTVFRLLAMMSWISWGLAVEGGGKALGNMRVYRVEVAKAAQALGWPG